MGVEIVEKKKRGTVCAECGASVTPGEECPECGSTKVKKSLVIVRKSVADNDEELDAVDNEEVEEDEDLDEDDGDEEEEEEEDDDDEDEEDDDEEEDDDDDDDDDNEPSPEVKKNLSLIGLESLNISTALAEDIVKVFSGGGTREDYERVMVEANNVFDAAADSWFGGSIVSKSRNKSTHTDAIQSRVDWITKGKKMPKKSNIAKRADLPEDVRKSLDEADAIVERDKERHWNEVAKGFSNYPGDPKELAGTLRALSESNPEAYKKLVTTLEAGNEIIGKSALFESFGAPGSGAPEEVAKRQERISKAQKLVDDGVFKSLEAAEVSLMNGEQYTPTNA